jgi:hypothetical protein
MAATWVFTVLREMCSSSPGHLEAVPNSSTSVSRDVRKSASIGVMTGARVNIDNFVRAETDRMFAAILHDAGGVNQWMYMRKPTPVDHQPVIRQNGDTLYSASVIDISKGAT